MSQSYRDSIVILDEASEVPENIYQSLSRLERGKRKMSDSTQQCLIIMTSAVLIMGTIFVGAYHLKESGKELRLKQLEKGYVYCTNVDGNSGYTLPSRCKR